MDTYLGSVHLPRAVSSPCATTATTTMVAVRMIALLASLNLLLGRAIAVYEARSREYCHNEVFQASCPAGHVIMMESALYGRMNLGRCVKTDFGFVGCYADVLGVSERRCSGRQTCQIRIPDVTFDDAKPCNDDLKSYYEARFSCLPVVTAEDGLCRGTTHLKAPTPKGYLSSSEADKTDCGSHTSPWYIEGKPGQKINITLMDFSDNKHQNTEALACIRYATIRDVSTGRNIDICGGSGKEKHVYTSVSNNVEIKMAGTDSFAYLLKYEVIGCADIPRPPNMWIKRKDDELLVGCPTSGERWRLVCKGNSWFGKIGNCSKEANEESERLMFGDVSFPVGVSILIIIVVALGIGGAILLVGLVMLRRRTRRRTRASAMKDVISMGESNCDGKSHDTLGHHHHITKMDSCATTASGRKGDPRHLDNEYSYVWEGADSHAGTIKGTLSKHTTTGGISGGGGGQAGPYSTDPTHFCPVSGLADTSFTEMPDPTYGQVGTTSTFCRTHREKPLAQYFELDPDVVPHAGTTLCPAGHALTQVVDGTAVIPTHVPCSDCEQHILDTLSSNQQSSTVCAIHSQ